MEVFESRFMSPPPWGFLSGFSLPPHDFLSLPWFFSVLQDLNNPSSSVGYQSMGVFHFHELAQSHASKFKTDACLQSLPFFTPPPHKTKKKKKRFFFFFTVSCCGRRMANVNICKFTEGLVYSPCLLNLPESQHDLWPSPEPINSTLLRAIQQVG